MLEKPTLVVFDLDNTLYSYEEANKSGHKALVELGAKLTGTSTDKFEESLFASRKSVKSRLGATGSSHSRLLYIHETLAELGFGNHSSLALNLEKEFWRNYFIGMHLRKGSEDLLSALRFNHVPIALVTDLTLQIQLRKLIYLKLESFFDVIVASEEVDGDKESLKPFELMVKRSNPDWLQNVWFIGDGIQDAPINQLCFSGKITSGVSWIKNSPNHGLHNNWSELSEIERALDDAF